MLISYIFQLRQHYSEIAQSIVKYSDIQCTSLTPDKILDSLIYRTPFYVNIYGSYKLSKNSPFFCPTVYIKAIRSYLKSEDQKRHTSITKYQYHIHEWSTFR